nr:MAG TPA: hypothetical protein [Bacteriophage sp.]
MLTLYLLLGRSLQLVSTRRHWRMLKIQQVLLLSPILYPMVTIRV